MTFFSCFVDTVEEDQQLGQISEVPPIIKRSPTLQLPGSTSSKQSPKTPRKVSIRSDESEEDGCHLTIPKMIAGSSSSETLTGIPNRIHPSVTRNFQY